MKRIVAIFLALVVITASVFAFAGCEYTPKWRLKDYGFVIYDDEQWAEFIWGETAEDGKEPIDYISEERRGGHTLMADCSLVEGYEKGEIFCVYLFHLKKDEIEVTSLCSLDYKSGYIDTLYPFFDKIELDVFELIILSMSKENMQLYNDYKNKNTMDEKIIKEATEKATEIIKFKLI